MADIYGGLVNEGNNDNDNQVSQEARQSRMVIRRNKLVSDQKSTDSRKARRRVKQQLYRSEHKTSNRHIQGVGDGDRSQIMFDKPKMKTNSPLVIPKFSLTSICGQRREMEDAVAIHPSFCKTENEQMADLHYFAVYDGHGCSHVALKCKERLHNLVREELNNQVEPEWKNIMEKSFHKMDKEILDEELVPNSDQTCGCHQNQKTVGSTAVVAIITPDKIIVANSGDSRAVLCRKARAIPLSFDHKPERPDEQNRIEATGGRVINWDIPRVLGVLSVSRAIGDPYLKPYVTSEPELTITDRTDMDDCLILASDGLWDKLSNEKACALSHMCLNGKFEFDDASTLLARTAMANFSSDNISVVVIDLRNEN